MVSQDSKFPIRQTFHSSLFSSSLPTWTVSLGSTLSTTKRFPTAFTNCLAIKRICDLYDWDGKGELDLFYLGDIFYALGFNITKKICVGLGMTDEENKKFAKFDEVVKKVQEGLATKVGKLWETNFCCFFHSNL
jgi:hypothetical protein